MADPFLARAEFIERSRRPRGEGWADALNIVRDLVRVVAATGDTVEPPAQTLTLPTLGRATEIFQRTLCATAFATLEDVVLAMAKGSQHVVTGAPMLPSDLAPNLGACLGEAAVPLEYYASNYLSALIRQGHALKTDTRDTPYPLPTGLLPVVGVLASGGPVLDYLKGLWRDGWFLDDNAYDNLYRALVTLMISPPPRQSLPSNLNEFIGDIYDALTKQTWSTEDLRRLDHVTKITLQRADSDLAKLRDGASDFTEWLRGLHVLRPEYAFGVYGLHILKQHAAAVERDTLTKRWRYYEEIRADVGTCLSLLSAGWALSPLVSTARSATEALRRLRFFREGRVFAPRSFFSEIEEIVRSVDTWPMDVNVRRSLHRLEEVSLSWGYNFARDTLLGRPGEEPEDLEPVSDQGSGTPSPWNLSSAIMKWYSLVRTKHFRFSLVLNARRRTTTVMGFGQADGADLSFLMDSSADPHKPVVREIRVDLPRGEPPHASRAEVSHEDAGALGDRLTSVIRALRYVASRGMDVDSTISVMLGYTDDDICFRVHLEQGRITGVGPSVREGQMDSMTTEDLPRLMSSAVSLLTVIKARASELGDIAQASVVLPGDVFESIMKRQRAPQ